MSDLDSTSTLRKALAAYATGVAVVTARAPDTRPVAMTVNSFTTVSLQPPLVLWSAHRGVGPFDAFQAATHYAVHVLHAGQEATALHFARDVEDKFTGVAYVDGNHGLPLLDDFSARFLCQVEQRLNGGDHLMLLGRILEMEHRPAEPLIFHDGRFRPV
ncbi:MAG: flavin reductase family protein [Ectothiorhodospiraceae bacterium]|nr:flavin reductase family protein [Ectothiorhodospiraceae bacterium]MCH8505227.1 flavin reductase family protein [Ectothiorhodospiraceae bacterium]